MTLDQYVKNINQRYKQGNATEHTFRGDLQQLIDSLMPNIRATNEPKRIKCGAPDYVLTKTDIPIGFIEAKDIGDKDLEGAKKTGNKEQFDRYKSSLNNLIFTDYLDFHFYRDGVLKTKIAIAEIQNGNIVALKNNFAEFTHLLESFCLYEGQTITDSEKLAKMMASKARSLCDTIEKAVTNDETTKEDSTLKAQMTAFKEILIRDIKPKEFADVYAQTITYGLFAARLNDPTLDTFSRQEAAELIPKSNPFLRSLFGYIAGPDIDDRIKWMVDDLAKIFLACNISEILKNYGRNTKTEDPIIHFYETFLKEYDALTRKERGVYYTPKPVVNFIVRAVDDILKTEFDLPKGLADNSKIKKGEKEFHRVQILDPATGTGTFLAEVVKQVHSTFKNMQGAWSSYVENDLIPRLNGFEILMASYAMAHLQLSLLLTETGFKPTTNKRLQVYLTNSLEESSTKIENQFTQWLSNEANEANRIKRDTPVMCIIGNPPYAVSSNNKGEWIQDLIKDYKKGLKEKSYNSLSDDYVKFIRFGQHFIEKNGSGVLAYISNNSFIDGLVFNQMRKNLLECFDKIYILDMHGNAEKKEVNIDGSVDNNVFNIKQGVSINIFVKTELKKTTNFATVFHFDLLGNREFKYNFLNKNSLRDVNWNKLQVKEPNLFFVKKDFGGIVVYEEGFRINELFINNAGGIKTERDSIVIHFEELSLKKLIDNLKSIDAEDFRKLYNEKDDGRDWKILTAKQDVLKNNGKIYPVTYRPFDVRKTYFTGKSKGFMAYPRNDVMKHLLQPNISIIFERQATIGNFTNIFISNNLVESHILGTMFSFGNTAPLYIYQAQLSQDVITQKSIRIPNLNIKIVNQIAEKLLLTFTDEKEEDAKTFAPIDILDYIYAVLHNPTYREKYKEFLKIDFPRVPYPKNAESFWQLVKFGGELRQLHLLESAKVEDYITQFNVGGDDIVSKIKFEHGKVYINDAQYFKNVPEVAWNFYIGGYQPAQKWLKDRKERTLQYADIEHYQKIIVALTETDRIMKEIDLVEGII